MEITDRGDLGSDLFAPTTMQGGKAYWGYELVTHVRQGDIVLHWHKTLLGTPAVVGWSRATGSYEETVMSWQARGTVGRARGTLNERPAWRMPLEGYTPLTEPVTITEVRGAGRVLKATRTTLEAQYGQPLYFPFGFSDKREIRAQQTYFVKMPRQVLIDLGLDSLADASSAPVTAQRTGKAPRSKRSGYIADAVLRSAIEWRAVDLARDWYLGNGYKVEYVGDNKPYDLVASRGAEVRRIEVKGSSGQAEKWELTSGEVDNARSHDPTDLFVVDGITFLHESDGSVTAEGGTPRRFADWTPNERDLKITRYRSRCPLDALTSPESSLPTYSQQ